MKYCIFFILITSNLFAQTFEFSQSLGEFVNASSFYITANGLIYVTDTDKDEIIMLDTLGKVLGTFGGYGWNQNSLDDPADVYADPLSIYVADKNNHAIKRFDKNLNYISTLFKRESDFSQEQFGYPLSCATSNQGDLYFIDSENKRIMKFDIFGNFQMNFGGFDAGKFQLKNPTQLAIASNNNIFVIDESDIVVFDPFGNGVIKINFDEKINSIRILFDEMVLCIDKEIFHTNLKIKDYSLAKVNFNDFKFDSTPVSSMIIRNKLFVLTQKELLLFSMID